MKQNLTLLLLLVAFGLNAQTIYVKQNASGTNDGTSWANAFTSLDVALGAATSGTSIWVAAGTYKPAGVAPNNSFLLAAGVNLYGGFAGTETSLSQRNISANATVLSGDINGNDVVGNFTTNRADNSPHVLIVFVDVDNNGTAVDGFTVRSGQTLTGTANADLTRRGGGILANATTYIRNCTFTDNFGESGAAVTLLGDLSDASIVENCVFNANKATTDAVLYTRATPSALIKKCSLTNNNTDGGALLVLTGTDIKVDSCLFERNIGPDYSSGIFVWQSNLTVSNTIFRKNKAANATAMYIDNRDGGNTTLINNCLFELDSTTNYGGTCIFSFKAAYEVHDCTFKNNVAPSSGAAFYNGEGADFLIKGCLFEGNKANFAGAVANYGANCVGTFEDCIFRNNGGTGGGGAVSNGFEANVTYKNSTFETNGAAYGGAIFTQNPNSELHIEGCLFKENATTSTAGAVLVNDSIPCTIVNTTFVSNTGTTGGAVSAGFGYPITIDKCQFIENIATTQGAGLNLNASIATITNSLFAKNINTGTGAGGAISNNATENEISKLKAVNCTFADNVAAIGGGIAQWENPDFPLTAVAELTLLNCLFQNTDAENYTIEEGEPAVISLNGNQSSDESLSTYLTQAKDKHNTLNTFQDVDNNNYAHTLASPASDGGVSAGAPADDILGISRAGIPDVGYREVKTSGINSPNFQLLSLQCVPNPTVDQTIISLKNETNGKVQISVWNQLGQQVVQFQAEKTANEFTFPMNVTSLAAGTYKVQVRVGSLMHEGTFAKF